MWHTGLIKFCLLFYFIVLLVSCGHTNSSSGINQDNGVEGILYSQKLIDNDDFFTGSHWNDPHVLYDDGEFVMFASSDLMWDGYVKIFRLVSQDGKEWRITNSGNPVFEPAESGWDSHSVETPAVVYYNNKYHMFYTGYDVAYDYSDKGSDGIQGTIDDDIAAKHFGIGHATSSDGIIWERESANTVVIPTAPYEDINLEFNQSVVGEPAPVVFNGKIYLYFTAVGAATEVGTTWQTIGLTVYDGAGWDTPRRVLTPDLDLYPRTSGEEFVGYSTPNAVVQDGSLHLFYDVVLNNPWTQDKIHHAYSSDGESNWIQDIAPLLEREDFSWTTDEIRSPSALIYNDNLYLYFAGHYDEEIEPVLCIGLVIYENM